MLAETVPGPVNVNVSLPDPPVTVPPTVEPPFSVIESLLSPSETFPVTSAPVPSVTTSAPAAAVMFPPSVNPALTVKLSTPLFPSRFSTSVKPSVPVAFASVPALSAFTTNVLFKLGAEIVSEPPPPSRTFETRPFRPRMNWSSPSLASRASMDWKLTVAAGVAESSVTLPASSDVMLKVSASVLPSILSDPPAPSMAVIPVAVAARRKSSSVVPP